MSLAAVGKLASPSFRGNSYLLLPPSRIPIKGKRKGPSMYIRSPESIHLSLNFSTIAVNGLLFWSERDTNHFLGLGLQNNQLKLASNLLGSLNDTILAPTTGILSDGSWHNVRILADHQHLQMQLDGNVIFNERLAFHSEIKTIRRSSLRSNDPRNITRDIDRRKFRVASSITLEDPFYLGMLLFILQCINIRIYINFIYNNAKEIPIRD